MGLFYFRANAQDPTRTTALRKQYERDLVSRFRALQAVVREVLEESSISTNAPRFTFGTDTEKVGAFMDWVRRQARATILEVREGVPMSRAAQSAWQNIYLRSAYQKGVARAGAQVRRAGATVDSSFVDLAFGRPIHADRVGIIYTRAYAALEGITQSMDRRISRVLADAMVQGLGVREIAKEITNTIDSIGITRARTLARTETINAHANATLNTYEEAGVEGVSAEAEFATAQDNRVCQKCESLEGKIYTLKEARGLIPVHPNCRCAWLPVIRNAKGKILK